MPHGDRKHAEEVWSEIVRQLTEQASIDGENGEQIAAALKLIDDKRYRDKAVAAIEVGLRQ